jgi:ATP-binding cassette subfamily F protein uup
MTAVPLLSLQDATKAFSDKPLFSDLSLVIFENERVALVGSNGSGKSTLLKVLSGIEELDSGNLNKRKGFRGAYVAQAESFDAHASIGDVLDSHLFALGFDHSEVARRSSVYLGLAGFDDPEKRVGDLSGGWRKRLAIARALAEEPDCLLLDEPTNHLDIESIEWLEDLLEGLTTVVVFVSHDRYFIERLATRVVEINTSYPRDHLVSEGGYADYIEQREELLEQLKQQRDSLANKVRREVEWLRQGVKARTTKSRSRINEAHRLIDALSGSRIGERASMELDFASTDRKTKELLKAERVSQKIGDRWLFRDVSLRLSPGSRLAVVGPNGSGKTTLVRTLLGELSPASGKIIRASNLRVSFMDQARSVIRDDISLREFLCPHGDSIVFKGESIHVAAWAARFLFSHTHLGRKMAALSGGERARAVLAKSIAQESDILVFDEPTNDLDIATLENLEEGFNSFPGAIVLITHDRYLLDRVASQVLGIAEGEAVIFGSYAQWDEYKKGKISQIAKGAKRDPEPSNPASGTVPATRKTTKKLSYRDARDLSLIEENIAQAESVVEKTRQQIESGEYATDATKLSELCSLLAVQEAEVERLYNRWQELESLGKAGKTPPYCESGS